MANPLYKQKMGEPPIFRFPLNPGVPSVTKITLKSNRLAIFLAVLRNGGSRLFLRQPLVLRFDLQYAPVETVPVPTASGISSSCYRDLWRPGPGSALINALA
jgi:hypothetical protein